MTEHSWLSHYQAPDPSYWSGRNDGTENPRFHQIIHCHDLTQGLPKLQAPTHYGLVGFACDVGVVRNQGRPGAATGPQAIRQNLANYAWHNKATEMQCYDFGDIYCDNGDLESAQRALAALISTLLAANIKPIVMGGGHEVAWGHYQGIAKHYTDQDLGIINFDAHFDLRPLLADGLGSSGTPFLQMAQHCQQRQTNFDYTCIGVQPLANTAGLFATAKNLAVNTILADDIHINNSDHCLAVLDDVLNRNEKIYLTLCMDVFATSIAPGVSAPQPLGLSAWQVMPLLRYIVNSGKVASFDIAELSPCHDKNNMTAKLAACFIAEYIQ